MTKKVEDTRVLTSKELNWSNVPINSKYFDDDLYKIIRFYVINSPCRNYCTQGYNLSRYGWKDKPWYSDRYLKRYLDEGVVGNKNNFQLAGNLEEMTSKLREANLLSEKFYEDTTIERTAIVNIEKNKYMSLFYHIRCALAHGRFAISENDGNIMYIMENGMAKGDKFLVKARMILSKQTLLNWIEIITKGPVINENNYVKECMINIINMISADMHSTKSQMKTALNESESFIRKIVEVLKGANVIKYNSSDPKGYWTVNENKKDKFLENYTKAKENESHRS